MGGWCRREPCNAMGEAADSQAPPPLAPPRLEDGGGGPVPRPEDAMELDASMNVIRPTRLDQAQEMPMAAQELLRTSQREGEKTVTKWKEAAFHAAGVVVTRMASDLHPGSLVGRFIGRAREAAPGAGEAAHAQAAAVALQDLAASSDDALRAAAAGQGLQGGRGGGKGGGKGFGKGLGKGGGFRGGKGGGRGLTTPPRSPIGKNSQRR